MIRLPWSAIVSCAQCSYPLRLRAGYWVTFPAVENYLREQVRGPTQRVVCRRCYRKVGGNCTRPAGATPPAQEEACVA